MFSTERQGSAVGYFGLTEVEERCSVSHREITHGTFGKETAALVCNLVCSFALWRPAPKKPLICSIEFMKKQTVFRRLSLRMMMSMCAESKMTSLWSTRGRFEPDFKVMQRAKDAAAVSVAKLLAKKQLQEAKR